MWANKSFSHCSITLPPLSLQTCLSAALCLAILRQSTQNGHCSPALLLIRSQASQVELPGVPKGELYFKNLSMSNEEKNPERGVTQISDQKKLRMKEKKSTPSFLLNTHRSDLLAGI